ncbi:MAG: glycosyltransferase, partial [Muribaculaceae bacterium]|nr:glycosyltransferase [Muribaculaceae bacterium]
MKYMISGGGTGGHIFPAIAIADAISRLDSKAEFLFVGAMGRMEMERVPAAGYKIVGLPVAGFSRSNMLANFGVAVKLVKSMLKARSVVS